MSEVVARVVTIDNEQIIGELVADLIRCKDCIWFHKPNAETEKSCKCSYHGCLTKEDRYCWWGEKDG